MEYVTVTGGTLDGIPTRPLINWAANVTASYAIDHWDELTASTIEDPPPEEPTPGGPAEPEPEPDTPDEPPAPDEEPEDAS
jgi:hypothetical protein